MGVGLDGIVGVQVGLGIMVGVHVGLGNNVAVESADTGVGKTDVATGSASQAVNPRSSIATAVITNMLFCRILHPPLFSLA